MYTYQGLQDIFYVMLYGTAASLAIMAAVCIFSHKHIFESVIEYYTPFLAFIFVIYCVRAVRQYGRWLLDNFADLERKEVWQSLLLLTFILFVHLAYMANEGSLFMEYLAQINTLFIIAFLLWRVETLQELEVEEDDISPKLKKN